MFSRGGPSLAAKLANIQHMPVLMAATVASDKPIEPYLVKDLIKMSFESSQSRAFLQEYLLNQLVTSRNVYVKLKVLKLLESLLERGHIEFKQNLRKQPEPLNETSRLRATRTRDDGIVTECSRIRDLSNRLLEMLYSDAPEMQPNRYPSPEYRSTSDGVGSSSSSGKMEGFGNTAYTGSKSKSSSNATDKLKALFGSSTRTTSSSTTPLVYDQDYATLDPVPQASSNTGPGTVQYGGYNTGVSHAPGRYLEHGLPEGAPHRMGMAGGGWGGVSNPPSSQPPPPLPSQPVTQQEENHIDTAEQDDEERNTEQERRLVDDITGPGGVKAAPPRESLTRFISRCKALDCLAIVELLRQKLGNEQTQIVLRTLFVLEAMLKSDIPDVTSHLDLVLEELNTLTHSTNSSIKAKTKKILHQLAVPQQQATSSNTGSRGAPGSNTVPSGATGTILDLLGEGGEGGEGGGGGEGREEENNEQENHTKQSSLPAEVAGLFTGMSVSGGPPSGGPPRPWGPSGGPPRQGGPSGGPPRPGGPSGGPPRQGGPSGGPPRQGGPSEDTQQPPRVHHKKKKGSPLVREPEVARERGEDLGDLLGLLTTSSETTTVSETPRPEATGEGGEGGEGGREEVSLMDLGEEQNEDFDPLTRTESVGSKSNSLAQSLSLGNTNSDSPSTGDGAVMDQLSGLDLTIRSQTHTMAPGMQNGTGFLHQPLTLDHSLLPMSSVSSTTSGPSPSPASIVSGVAMNSSSRPAGVVMGGASQIPSQVTYVPAPVPYGMQPVQRMGQKGVPMYTAAPGLPFMYMNQPQLGGAARPVQRPQVTESDTTADESSFDFLSKSSRGSAFDFVKEEINSAKRK